MKPEYIPTRADVIMQNEPPNDVYIVVSGEVEIVFCDTEGEQVVGILRSGDIFGEISALCDRPQCYTYRTKTLSQLLKLNKNTLMNAMQTKQDDNKIILKNFLQVMNDTIDYCIPVVESDIKAMTLYRALFLFFLALQRS